MDQRRIKELIDLLGASDLTELTLSEGGSTLALARHGGASQATPAPAATQPTPQAAAPAASTPAAASQPAVAAAAAQATEVCSPLYGILHLTPSPDEPPFVTVGSTVQAGQTLCIVEAMKMFHQVKASAAGTVQALLAEAGQEVESGQPLFRLGEGQ